MINKSQAQQLQYLIEVRDNAVEQMHRFETGTTNYTHEHCESLLKAASANLFDYINILTEQKITSNIADLNAKIHGR